MTQTTLQFKLDRTEKSQFFQTIKNLGFTPSQALRLFIREVNRTKKIPVASGVLQPSEEQINQAFENFMILVNERTKNPPEALKGLTLEELDQMIDEEREAVYQEKLKKQSKNRKLANV